MEDPAGFLLRGLIWCHCRANRNPGPQGVIPAQAGIQTFKAFDKTGLLPRAGMASGAIRLKSYRNCLKKWYQKIWAETPNECVLADNALPGESNQGDGMNRICGR